MLKPVLEIKLGDNHSDYDNNPLANEEKYMPPTAIVPPVIITESLDGP